MYIARATWPSTNGKSYESIYLRESYRDGTHVRKRNIANLTHCDPKEIAAIELALGHKNDLTALASLEQSNFTKVLPSAPSGPSPKSPNDGTCGISSGEFLPANWHSGKSWRVSWSKALASPPSAWSRCMPPARSWAGNAASTKTICTTISPGCARAPKAHRTSSICPTRTRKPQLFLYDVTSSYLEGDHNAFGAYGYNRDGKKNKKQIVIGLLCDEEGRPVSIEVFRGNTQDPKTFPARMRKAGERFGCERVTFVGDRGMIKSGQIEELAKVGFHYITAITKPQIETLLKAGILQMELFDDAVCEVEQDSVRYVLGAILFVPRKSRYANQQTSQRGTVTGQAKWLSP